MRRCRRVSGGFMAMLLVYMNRLSSSGIFVRSPIVQNCVQRVRGSEIAQRITGYLYLTLCHTHPSHMLQPPPRSQMLASTEPLPTLCGQADFDTCWNKNRHLYRTHSTLVHGMERTFCMVFFDAGVLHMLRLPILHACLLRVESEG